MDNRSQRSLVKILLVGDSGVGKSALLLRYTDDIFTESFITTIGIDMKIKEVIIKEGEKSPQSGRPFGSIFRPYVLQIWDTAGQERFRTITTAYYRGADGILLVYDTTDETSLENLIDWVEEAKKEAYKEISVIVVGTKGEMKNPPFKSLPSILQTIETFVGNVEHIVCSSKTGDNVELVFQRLTEKINLKRKKGEKYTPEGPFASRYNSIISSSSLYKGEEEKKNRCCYV